MARSEPLAGQKIEPGRGKKAKAGRQKHDVEHGRFPLCAVAAGQMGFRRFKNRERNQVGIIKI
jgi:hypothetical protein